MKKKTWIWFVVIFVLILGLLGGCLEDTEYERAGKEFGSWVNKVPDNWSAAEKQYFDDFMDWADKN